MRDFRRDVNDPNTKHAEIVVGDWLRKAYGGAVADKRGDHGAYDFMLQLTYDVKCSKWLGREGRVHFEYANEYPNARRTPGWSTKEELQYVVYVNPVTWEAHIIRMKAWRKHVAARLREAELGGLDKPAEWIHSPARNRDYVTHSWSIPLDELRAAQRVVVRSFQLPAPERGTT